MDLRFNKTASFTKWIVAGGLLQERFVVIDVGVQGGENPRWHLLGDYLTVHGFDAIKEVVEELRARNADRSNLQYHWIAAGNEDGEREFYVNRNDPFSSSMYRQGDDRFDLQAQRADHARRVSVRKLDTLLREGAIPRADFLKVDVEGFEKDVFLGAKELLDSGVLGIETESNFGISPSYPASHLATLQSVLLAHKFLVFDLNYNRIPRAAFQQALQRKGLPAVRDQESVGKICTLNVLFCRDLIDESDSPQNYETPAVPVTVDQIIKMMIILELHGLNDIALDTAERFRDRLGARLDVDRAIALLADPRCRLSRMEALNLILKMVGPATNLGLALRAAVRIRGLLPRRKHDPFPLQGKS